ncbi:MAG: Hsp20/alpha crystallin family protein [Smithellaceae bacterium]|nr:Hsp20/alpha crystallin family protein [Smithellaceae bacterium]MDD3259179.1 Hsp20/alpha crystallin family protein [Smithellaceae bacterium]MDD3849273.1 Hsp20/alpha crystallin family protein [Smithellaceae bacterium]HOG13322.1 Hsp20/alpha crystallin family protein [Smithellaceae bacterium]HPL10605.1 Hsp20/alpha crystallin family protein [Smithellaceae bacterium]
MMRIKNLLPTIARPAARDDDHPFYSLQRQMNSLFDDFLAGFEAAPRALSAGGFGAFIPSVDVKESDKDFVIRAELPGVEEKDIEVTITGDSVTIKGEKKEEKEDKGKNYYYMERSYGSFNRVIPLAGETDANKASAGFKNGVLNICIPKIQSAKAKGTKVPIKAG